MEQYGFTDQYAQFTTWFDKMVYKVQNMKGWYLLWYKQRRPTSVHDCMYP